MRIKAVAGDELQLVAVQTVQADLAALHCVVTADNRQRFAVCRPDDAIVAALAQFACIIDDFVLTGLQIQQPQAAQFIGMRQMLAIRRREHIFAVELAIAGQHFSFTDTVSREAPDFIFAAGIDKSENPFVIGREDSTACTGTCRQRNIDTTLRTRACNRDMTMCGDHDFVAAGRDFGIR